MSRNPRIEQILALWWDAETCPIEFRSERFARLNGALMNHIQASGITATPIEVQEALRDHFVAFKRERYREVVARMPRRA
jgi:hypothetical protein